MDTPRQADVVFSLAGHDKGEMFAVLETDGEYAYLVDGKRRKLSSPKKKSIKHLRLGKLGPPELAEAWSGGKATDSVILRHLAVIRSEVGMTEEGSQLVKR